MSSDTYWKTIEYLGAGFVLQRKWEYNSHGEDKPYIREDSRGSYHSPNDYSQPERIIHVMEAENIDTSSLNEAAAEL